MGPTYIVLWILPVTFLWVASSVHHRFSTGGAKRPPPGPRPLPLVGNLLQLGDQVHRSLADLARVHGPLMSLRLGRIPVVVASSPSVAKQVLQKHDQALAFRSPPDALTAHNHKHLSIGWLPPGGAWRLLRRLCSNHLFSTPHLDANHGFRTRKVQELVSFVTKCSQAGTTVDVGRAVFTATLNLISNTLFSADVVSHESESSAEFKALVRAVMVEAGAPNLADYFPLLRWVDPQGIRRREDLNLKRLHQLFDRVIDGRRKSRSVEARSDADDFLDVLLESNAKSELDRPSINTLLVDIFIAGSDTSATTVEWAMAELFHCPRAMAKVCSELQVAMKGSAKEAVEESDIVRLPYLQAVMKETLRIHPPVPFLIPRRASAAVEISTGTEGCRSTYTVPEGAMVLVNAWAIGRDPDAWGADADVFLPERFLEGGGGGGVGVDFRGFNMELIPFGAGRRICPGLPLAVRMVPLMLANLLWTFDWDLPEGMTPADVDLTESYGITLGKAKPVLATPRPRMN